MTEEKIIGICALAAALATLNLVAAIEYALTRIEYSRSKTAIKWEYYEKPIVIGFAKGVDVALLILSFALLVFWGLCSYFGISLI